MTIIERVSCMPSQGIPQVLDGEPQLGDTVRITRPNGGVIYEETYRPPTPVVPPEFKTLTPSEFFKVVLSALGPDRTAQLLGLELVKMALSLAKTVDRNVGNTPVLVAYLQGLSDNPLTQEELESIEAAWRAA